MTQGSGGDFTPISATYQQNVNMGVVVEGDHRGTGFEAEGMAPHKKELS
jgi:hypothetical protein